MQIYYDHGLTQPDPRLHPYTAADASQSGFVDFTAHPELIESSLEDFRELSQTTAAKTLYDFLRWINGPESHLGTCDCGMRPVRDNQDSNSTRALRRVARIYILFRDLQFNSSMENSEWLRGRMMTEMSGIDPTFSGQDGVIGFTKQPALQIALSNGEWQPDGNFRRGVDDPGLSHHLMLTFFAYGESDEECLSNLERMIKNVRTTAELISNEIRTGLAE